MHILVSNDDGYQAPGIKQLIKSLSIEHKVSVVAPNTNMSAASSSLTISRPIQPIKVADNIYRVDATPADCAHLALCGLIKDIDLVVTGINLGANLGDDAIYSGTVAGAIEGRFLKLPSIAISLASWEGKHLTTAGAIARRLVNNISKSSIDSNTILNVNVPDVELSAIAGMQTTRLGSRHMSSDCIVDKNDATLYWVGENGRQNDNSVGTDFHAIDNNYVSITPLHIDLTNNSQLDNTNSWLQLIE